MNYTHIFPLLCDGLATAAAAQSSHKSIAHAAVDLCSEHTVVETYCLAKHHSGDGDISHWVQIHAEKLPQLLEETPGWIFDACEAVKAICDRKTDLITFHFEDGSRHRIGIEWIEDEDEDDKSWRTLQWLDHPVGGPCSVIRSGDDCEDPVMALTRILSELLDQGKVECEYSGKGNPADPVMVAGAIVYKLSLSWKDLSLYRMTLCELSNRYLVEESSRRYSA